MGVLQISFVSCSLGSSVYEGYVLKVGIGFYSALDIILKWNFAQM